MGNGGPITTVLYDGGIIPVRGIAREKSAQRMRSETWITSMPERWHAPSTPLQSAKHDRLAGDIAAQIPPENSTLTVSVLQ